jgi:DHA1 family multidrug resistance protein-like MFS transporter
MTVALTGFISTCGSSIGVPGIHAVRDEFGVDNEKVGVMITSFYVLGLG